MLSSFARKSDLEHNTTDVYSNLGIDETIRGYMLKLTKLGFLTYSSCSGYYDEHIKKKCYKNWLEKFPDSKFNFFPSFCIYVYSYKDKQIFNMLKVLLYGTGWDVKFLPSGYRYDENNNIETFRAIGERQRYRRRIYTPISVHYKYPNKTDEQKRRAWIVLVTTLSRGK